MTRNAKRLSKRGHCQHCKHCSTADEPRLSRHAQVNHLGFFDYEEDAARAYDAAALAIRGPYANTNFANPAVERMQVSALLPT